MDCDGVTTGDWECRTIACLSPKGFWFSQRVDRDSHALHGLPPTHWFRSAEIESKISLVR